MTGRGRGGHGRGGAAAVAGPVLTGDPIVPIIPAVVDGVLLVPVVDGAVPIVPVVDGANPIVVNNEINVVNQLPQMANIIAQNNLAGPQILNMVQNAANINAAAVPGPAANNEAMVGQMMHLLGIMINQQNLNLHPPNVVVAASHVDEPPFPGGAFTHADAEGYDVEEFPN